MNHPDSRGGRRSSVISCAGYLDGFRLIALREIRGGCDSARGKNEVEPIKARNYDPDLLEPSVPHRGSEDQKMKVF
jgi:hypothetical protein